jgi:hypothetical protein
MSTNPFVCQSNSQEIGGFLAFVKGTCAGLIATRRSTGIVRSRLKRARNPIRRKSNMLKRHVPAMYSV